MTEGHREKGRSKDGGETCCDGWSRAEGVQVFGEQAGREGRLRWSEHVQRGRVEDEDGAAGRWRFIVKEDVQRVKSVPVKVGVRSDSWRL